MFEVSVTGWFSAAHQLRLADGSLEPLHGHHWRVTVTYSGPRLDPTGLLLDFTALQSRLDQIVSELHDRNLNALPAFGDLNPSAENVALHVARAMGSAQAAPAWLRCVEVEEAPGCVARYCPVPGDEKRSANHRMGPHVSGAPD